MMQIIIKSSGYLMLIAIGYLLKVLGIFSKEDKGTFGKLLMYIFLPCAFVANFAHYQTDDSMLVYFLIGLVANVIAIGIAKLLTAKKQGRDKALYIIQCSGYNIGAFTTPFVSGFLPGMAVVISSIYDIGNSLFCIGGVYPVARQALDGKKKHTKDIIIDFMKKLFSSVPFDTYLFMLIISIAGIRMPQAVNEIASPIGSCSIIITMIMIGVTFEIHITKSDLLDILKILLVRYLLGMVLMVAVYHFTGLDALAKQVIALCLMAPATSISPTYCYLCNCNENVYGAVSSLSVLISLASFGVIMAIL